MSQVPFPQPRPSTPEERGQGPDVAIRPRSGGPDVPGRRLSPIEEELMARVGPINQERQRITNRIFEIELAARQRPKTLDARRTLRSIIQLLPGQLGDPRDVRDPFPGVFLLGADDPADQLIVEEQNLLKQQSVEVTSRALKLETQLLVVSVIPGMVLTGTAQSMDDIIDRLGPQIQSPEDFQIAQRAFDHAMAERQRFEASIDKSPEEFIKSLGSRKNLTIYGLTALSSSSDLLGFITALRAPQLPDGSSIEELREVLGNAGIPREASALFLAEADDFSLVIAREIDTINTRTFLWQSDMIRAIETGTFSNDLESFKGGVSFLDNPGLAFGVPFDWMDRHYWKPVGGLATRGLQTYQRSVPEVIKFSPQTAKFFGLRPEHYLEFEAKFVEARASGDNAWLAYGVAFEELNTNAVSKIIVEMLADPTSYIGFGVAKLFRFSPKLYTVANTLERGWVRLWDVPFIALQKGVTKIIPRTPGMVSEVDSFRHLQIVADYLNSAPPRSVSYRKTSMVTNRASMELALETLQKNPSHSGLITDAVRGLLERPMLTREQVTTLSGSIRRAIDPGDLDAFTADIDNLLTHSRTLPAGATLDEDETITLILGKLGGATPTEADRQTIRRFLRTERDTALSRFRSIINQNTVSEFESEILAHRRFILSTNQLNPLNEYQSQFGMLMSSMSSQNQLNPFIRTLASSFEAANKLSYGFTRMYLMSTFYGPFNILETAVKSAIMSINPKFKGRPMDELFQNTIGFETLLPRHFSEGRTFIPEAQDIAGVGSISRARDGGTRAAFKRIWTSKRNVLSKLYASSDEFFIQTGARLGLEQSAHVMNSLLKRHLLEGTHTREVASRVATMVEEASQGLKAHMAPDVLEMHKEEMFRLAMHDVASLDNMSTEFVAGFTHAKRVSEIMSPYNLLDPAIKNHLTDLAVDGELFRLLRSGELDGRITEALWQQIMAEPEVFLSRIRELTRAVVEIPIDTIEQLQVQTRMLEDIGSATTHIVEQQMSATQAYTRNVLDLEKKNDIWQGQWLTSIQPIMDEGERAAQVLVDQLRASLQQGRRRTVEELTAAGGLPAGVGNDVRIAQTNLDQALRSGTSGEVDSAQRRLNEAQQRLDESTASAIERGIEAVGAEAPGFDLSLTARNQYDELINGQLLRVRRIAQTREAINDFTQQMLVERDTVIIPDIRRAGGKPNSDHPRIRDWWGRFNEGRDRVWRDQQQQLATDTANVASLAGAIDALPLPQPMDLSGRPMVMADVAYLYGVSPDSVTQGMYLADLKSMRSRVEWTEVVFNQANRVSRQNGQSPEALGISKDKLGDLYDRHMQSLKLNPAVDVVATPRFREWEALHIELQSYALQENLVLKPSAVQALDDTARGLRSTIQSDSVTNVIGDTSRQVSIPDGGSETLWDSNRRAATQDAVDEYNINFPVYDKNNAFNAGAKFIFPFWTYEAHRWSYLPRVAIRNPGLTHAFGLYDNNTDRGYIPIPGTSLQGNFLRNSIMMGGLQRWVNRDFPEFYDQYPDFANVMDQIGRLGFYPNVYISGAMASPLFNQAGISQVGELMPPPIGSALELIVAADPDNPFSNALAEIILPNRFRDYRIAVRLAENMPPGEDARASEILFKKLRGEDLTEEENIMWSSAERRASLDAIVDYQVGLFRLRPEEMLAARELSKQIILRYVPITEEQYDEAHKLGMPIEQYFPFPPELNDALGAVEEIARWRGLASNLGESQVSKMLLAQRDFWSRSETRRDELNIRELDFDRQFSNGTIFHDEWRRSKNELGVEMNRFIEDLKVSPEFRNVPIEFQDRVKFATEHNTLAPVQHPVEEMVTYYFSRTPDDFRFYDPEIGGFTTDWDGFYKWRTTIEDSLIGANREEFLTRIHRWDTNLDKVRRADYEGFIRPYKSLFGLTLAEHSAQEQALIRQFYSTDSADVREELRAVEIAPGTLLVSSFQRQLSRRRRDLRVLDPEMDARLAFWGEISSLATDAAKDIHSALYGQYGIQAREVVPVEQFSIPATTAQGEADPA